MENGLPKTLQQAILFFSIPENCFNYLVSRRWANGVICPACGRDDASFLVRQQRWQCKTKHPRRQFSVKTGTIFEDSPLGLDKWLTTVWMVTNCKNGISSYEVHRAIGVTQKSAWFMLHRIRLAMQNGSLEKLSGTVEIDESWLGGKARNMHKSVVERRFGGKRPADFGPLGSKAIVMGILERHGEVRTHVVVDTKRETLDPHIRANVEKGSTVYTDSHLAYTHLNDKSAGYVHDFVSHVEEYVRGNVHTNGIENYWSLLKRTLRGTYVSVEPFHLFRYLDEQSYRFNNRKANDQERFVKVTGQVAGKRLMYKDLTGKSKEGDRQEN